VGIDEPHHQLKIQHDEVKGFMPAMTMEFNASAGDMTNAKVGQRIRAELVVTSPSDFHLEKIWPADSASTATIDAAANALTQDTVIRGNKAYREVGEKLPSFALYDQTGAVLKSDRFRGKQIMLNFIYTRCPIATMCPAATLRFQETQKAARAAGVANLELVSITLDPEFDTPGVLKEYATERGIDTSNWSFLTGPEGAIKSLLAQFGVFAEFEGSLLKHTLATLLIDEKGKILDRADGSTWEVQEFVSKMKR
jgi:protein SCO1/2